MDMALLDNPIIQTVLFHPRPAIVQFLPDCREENP